MCAEGDIKKLASREFTPVFLRHGTVYGVSPKMRFDLVVNNLVAWAFSHGKVNLKSDGYAWRPLVHVEDVCLALACAVEMPEDKVGNAVFNIGRTEGNILIRDLATMVARAVAGSRVVFASNTDPDKRSYRVSFRKAETSLPGFEPRWTIQEGIEQVYAACVKAGLRNYEFEGHRYDRLAHLKYRLEAGTIDQTLRPSPQMEGVPA